MLKEDEKQKDRATQAETYLEAQVDIFYVLSFMDYINCFNCDRRNKKLRK